MHTHSKWLFWWHYGCPACKVRQMRYGYRMDPLGYSEELKDIRHGNKWDYQTKKWMLRQLGELQ